MWSAPSSGCTAGSKSWLAQADRQVLPRDCECQRRTLLLRPYRVLDLTGPLGFLCGKTLADLGADVIKVEPPGGDPSRKCPPLLRLGSGEPQSLSWLAFNANKRGITLDLESPLGQELFARLAKI